MFSIYFQKTKKDKHERCFHTFARKEKADRYAMRGARVCQAICIVIDSTGKQVSKFDYRPN